MYKCPECEGNGYKVCDGEVKMVNPPYKKLSTDWFSGPEHVAYYVYPCLGTGKCTFCNGTGKMKCEACNGSVQIPQKIWPWF